ncbi:MAG: metallophosphoesterase, partial [Muribaculaceae bacterium]|nr:metallophosphoesterase [Muribaculaceae bacterium]
MRLAFITLLVFFILNLGVDFYIFRALMSDLRRQFWSKIQFWTALIFAIGLIAMMIIPINTLPDSAIRCLMWVIFGYIAVYLAKYIFFIFDICSRIPLLGHHPRWKWLSFIGALLGLGAFCWLWWGALYTRFSYDINKVDVKIKNLPENFEGFRIVQISDLHLGTFSDDTTFVNRIVTEVNSIKPDIVLFTGDIVNRNSDELKPFISTLSRLHAPYGVYSILGNHDYGDYEEWPDENAKSANLDSLVSYQKQMGWKLMRNETAWLVNKGDSIALIGVENVGDPPFHTYGDLSKAYSDINDNHTKILMSHNPAHWH